MTPRAVEPEILDGLSRDDPSGIRSRRDLRRVHRAMGTCSIIARALRASGRRPRDGALVRILELGAGDGHLMLNVARSLRAQWSKVEICLLDRIDLVERSTTERYARVGWKVKPVVADVLEWSADRSVAAPAPGASGRWDIIIANLFLHHFEGAALRALLAAVEARTECFLACEPRRSWMAHAGSRLIGAIGANTVTRSDAASSVRAGFCESEITELWPDRQKRWVAKEYRAGFFSHCFYAERLPLPEEASNAA